MEFEPALTFERITEDNRAYVEMHGGWGPHLRAPMRAADGSLWFAYDGGPSVSSNTTIRYARRGADGDWADAVSQEHAGGVQQNAAHVMAGNVLLTYAVNPAASLLEECYLDVTDLSNRACNTISIGGPYSTPPNSNYVGAALDPNGARIVWFTVVGAAGGVGDFVYTYNFGGGWNGPVVTTLPGYNDMAYVRASFSGANTISWLGQAYSGPYPDGEYGIGAREVSLGEPADFVTLGPAVRRGETVRSAGDVWVDPDSGDTHALARVDQQTLYFVRPAGASWAQHAEPVDVLDSVSRARFLTVSGSPLMALTSGGDGLRLRWADPTDAIDWNEAPSVEVIVPTEGFEAPSALYTAGPEYQTAAAQTLHFALCGQYPVADHEVWYVSVDRQ